VNCFRTCFSSKNPRISPLALELKSPRLLLFSIASQKSSNLLPQKALFQSSMQINHQLPKLAYLVRHDLLKVFRNSIPHFCRPESLKTTKSLPPESFLSQPSEIQFQNGRPFQVPIKASLQSRLLPRPQSPPQPTPINRLLPSLLSNSFFSQKNPSKPAPQSSPLFTQCSPQTQSPRLLLFLLSTTSFSTATVLTYA